MMNSKVWEIYAHIMKHKGLFKQSDDAIVEGTSPESDRLRGLVEKYKGSNNLYDLLTNMYKQMSGTAREKAENIKQTEEFKALQTFGSADPGLGHIRFEGFIKFLEDKIRDEEEQQQK